MNYYDEIRDNLLKSEIYDRVHDYVKDRNKVNVYFEVGKLLSEAGKEYGKNIIKQYSEKLVVDVGKKYNTSTLYRMKQFYEKFADEKFAAMRQKLSWTHFRELLSLKNINEIIYYLNECVNKNLTYRELHELIKQNTYNRLSDETKNKLIESKTLKVDDLVPNPIIIRNNLKCDNLTEYGLKQLIINSLDSFLSQLGEGFTYIGNEYKIKFGNKYNYIDILLYNIKYRCYVVVELKVTELKKEHTGQIMTYMNYINDHLKGIDENSTVGIIICKEDNKYVIRYCSDDRIIYRVFELV